MATAPHIHVESLLLPIPPGLPKAPNLDRSSVRQAFDQVLRSGDAAQQRQAESGGGVADLDGLIELGTAYLAEKSKDLVVAAWMVEALTMRYGFAGLRDGLMLMRGLIADCWEICHPPVDQDGDTEPRARSLASVGSGRSVLLILRRVSLAELSTGAGQFCYLDARNGPRGPAAVPTEEELSTGPVGESVSQSSRQFYERLADDLSEAAQAAQALGQEVTKRFRPADAPELKSLRATITEIQQVLKVILALKRRQEPDSQAPASATKIAEPLDLTLAPSMPATPGPRGAALDYGRVVIEFAEQARELADDAAELKKNREAYEKHKEEMRTLDNEFEAIVKKISSNKDFEALLMRKLGLARIEASTEE